MTKIILVRHCQAEGNLKRFFQGKIDSDITELGKKQIAQTAALLSSEPIDVLISSPKKRALLSAQGINIYHELEIKLDDAIVEIDAGAWEGVPLVEVEKLYPEQFQNWNEHPELFCAPGGESMRDVYDRVSKALLRIVEENKGKTVCVVSHGCAIKNMMCFVMGIGFENIKDVPLGSNMSVNVISFDDDLKPTVIVNNYSEHLQEGYNSYIN